MERPVSFFVMLFILLFAGIGFIFVVFDLHGFSFIFELGLLLAFMFVLTFAMFLIYQNKEKSWGIIAAVMLLLLFDVFIIFLVARKFTLAYITTVIFTLAGFIVALLNAIMLRNEKVETATPETQYDKSKYYYPFVDRKEAAQEESKEEARQELKSELKHKIKEEIKKENKNVEATFTPGKFVASKKANKFHSPKCDWAQRISKENQIWFNSEAEAKAKGFEPDKCVE